MVEGPTSRDETERLVEELLRSYNTHDSDRMENLLSETFLVVSPQGPTGLPGWMKRTTDHFRAFPDSKLTRVHVSGEGDSFRIEVVWSGTQAVPPTGRSLRTPVVFQGQIKSGKIESLRVEYDREAVRMQLGPGPNDPL